MAGEFRKEFNVEVLDVRDSFVGMVVDIEEVVMVMEF